MKTTLSPTRRLVSRIGLLLALAVGALLPQVTLAQPAGLQPELTIESVTIRFIDLQNLNEEIALANMRARKGMRFSETLIDQDVRTLFGTGLFEGIEVKREIVNEGVNLVYELRPKFRVGAITFEGNADFSSRRLERELTLRLNGPLDERVVKTDAQKLFEFYQKAGFSQATVDYTIDRNRATGRGSITFKISEGERVKISSIEFVGNEHLRSRKLRGEMETASYFWLWSWITGGGRLQDDEFEDDLEKLRELYREEGFLDVAIERTRVEFTYPSAGRVVIKIPIVEGRRYKVGEISFRGNKLFPSELLHRLLRVRSGDTFTPSKLDKDIETLRDFYGRDGYLETSVRLVRRPNLQTGAIDVEYAIEESGKFLVESVIIEGNTKTRSNVILRELVLGPGDTFDTVRMKISQQRLRNTRFFGDAEGARRDEGVDLSPQTTAIPDRKNLRVQVKEGRTGNLSFGAGFSSLEQAMFFAEVSQSNFDVLNWRSFFQGAGQKFRLRLQLGSQSSDVMLQFEEPWAFERELALGFSLFRTRQNYLSDLYDQLRTGFEVYGRKRLIELVEGRLAYSWVRNEFVNLQPGAVPLFSGDAQTTVSRVSLSLLRDTRDSLVTTTRGNRFEFITEMAGGIFGGGEDFYRLEFRGAQFFPTFQFQKQVFQIIGRVGVVQEFGRNATSTLREVGTYEVFQRDAQGNVVIDATTGLPVFTLAPLIRPVYRGVPIGERYFLGGPNNLRGFEFRDVGPKQGGVATAEPIGGKTSAWVTFEYSMDIVDPIRWAIFYDWGFVNKPFFDFDPRNYNDNFGVGLRIFILGAPLRIDYGIPLRVQGTRKTGNQFNFSFGTQF